LRGFPGQRRARSVGVACTSACLCKEPIEFQNRFRRLRLCLLLTKTRFVRIGDAIRPRLHVQQCLLSSQSSVCLVHLCPAKHEDATHYNRWRIFPGSVAGALLSGEAALNPTPHALLVVKVCRSGLRPAVHWCRWAH